jgi:hypothetical protein
MRLQNEFDEWPSYLYSPNSEGFYRHVITNASLSDVIENIEYDDEDIDIPDDSIFLGLFYNEKKQIFGSGQYIELDLITGKTTFGQLDPVDESDVYNGRVDRANACNYPNRKVNTMILFKNWSDRYRILAPAII